MSDEKIEIHPEKTADIFLEQFEKFNEGTLDGAVFSDELSGNFLIAIRDYPLDMITFFIQTSYCIKIKAEERFGPDSDLVLQSLTQFQSVMFSWLIIPLSSAMRANLTLMNVINGGHPMLSADQLEPAMGVPETSAKDVFAGIEGLDFSNWIGQEEETDGDVTPPDPSPPDPSLPAS